ncbi:MAG: GNAT family N-acetyltransferase [Chloroflexota bacterium]
MRGATTGDETTTNDAVLIRPLEEDDRAWAEELITARWGGVQIVSRGRVWEAPALPGFVAWRGGVRVGLATYRVEEAECELVTLDAVPSRHGVGTALLRAVEQAARRAGCRRLWLITTNDNLQALRFYQRRGFHLAALHVGAVEASRRLKPSIPQVGAHGIPLRDELELELYLE